MTSFTCMARATFALITRILVAQYLPAAPLQLQRQEINGASALEMLTTTVILTF